MHEKLSRTGGRMAEGKVDSHIYSPSHYTAGKIEVIDFLEDQRLGFHRGNVVKYVCRAGRKDPTKEIDDLKKAAWYLAREIKLLTFQKDEKELKNPDELQAILEAKDRDFWDNPRQR